MNRSLRPYDETPVVSRGFGVSVETAGIEPAQGSPRDGFGGNMGFAGTLARVERAFADRLASEREMGEGGLRLVGGKSA